MQCGLMCLQSPRHVIMEWEMTVSRGKEGEKGLEVS